LRLDDDDDDDDDEVDHLQILLESSAPRPLGASCFTPAIRWSPGYCHFRRSMIW